MIFNKKLFLGVLVMFLLLAACSQAEEVAPPTEAVAAVVPEATEAAEVVEEPTASSLPDSPTNTPAPAESEPATAEAVPTETTESAPAEEAQVNGRYETTYFRGLETAAVTMIDYSDFL
jgi:hypothetical protein